MFGKAFVLLIVTLSGCKWGSVKGDSKQ